MNRVNRAIILAILILLSFPASGFSPSHNTQHLDLSTRRLSDPPPTDEAPDSNKLYLPVFAKPNYSSLFGVEATIRSNRTLDAISRAGAYWIRRNGVEWSEVEPVKGARNWAALASLEGELFLAASKGLQVILIVRGTPAWARKIANSPCGPIANSEIASFGQFMYDLVARYSVPPYNVKYWEIWNEPDATIANADLPYGCWGDGSDLYFGGRNYGTMLMQIYPRIKAADPDAQVLVGGLLLDCDPRITSAPQPDNQLARYCLPANFLEGILYVGGKNSFDGVSFHAYDFYGGAPGQYANPGWNSAWNTTGPSLEAKVEFIASVLKSRGAAGKYLLNTEVALLCNEPCTDLAGFEATKASFLVQAYAQAIAINLQANIWYDLYGSWKNSGLAYTDESPRPAFTAYQFANYKMGQAILVRKIATGGVVGYEFDKKGSTFWVIWSKDGKPVSLALPAAPLAGWDFLGNQFSAGLTVQVGASPIYLDW